ncbi:hypothetical protein INH39_25635 [Massilia violaceinigra]|uniref:DNA transfer protein n=1 Tax=Massilia violaceinigra TaxID=2045208 RepID=A0ABY4A426_9BURK|nr:hypothetical protein [Massilia violaceinigra]UOD28794.1 hypothetical protein INH39_25635 [Massilia violaceinigra]
MGLLDMFNDPQSAGLLGAGAQILERSGDTSRPYGIGQALGTGISSYMQINNSMRARKQQEEQERAQQAMREMQMQEMQAEMAQKQAAQEEAKRLQGYYTGQKPPAAAGASALGGGNQQPSAMGAQQPAQSGGSLYDSLMQDAIGLRQNGFIAQAEAKMKEAIAVRPKYATEGRTVMGPDGKPMLVQMADDGNVRPIQGGYGAAEKLHFGDNGQNLVGMDQYTGQVKSSIGKQQTLESLASERSAAAGRSVTMRGQNMTDSRQREMNELTRQGQRTQIITDPLQGPLLIDKATGQARQAIGMDGNPIRGEQAVKKESQAKGLLPVLDAAEKLIDGATGSYFGAMADEGMKAFGASTKGGNNIAQLKVLEGNIMMNQPRMEGPQSNMDVQLYRQMAGLIGDPTVPAATKKAAFGTLREIQARNAGGGQQAAPAKSGGWSIRKVD